MYQLLKDHFKIGAVNYCGLPLPSNQKKRVFEIPQISPKPCRIYGLPGAARNQFISSGRPSTAEESKGYIAGSTSSICFPPGTNFKPTFWSTLMNRKPQSSPPTLAPRPNFRLVAAWRRHDLRPKNLPWRIT
jgi:hypothetical protein